MWAPLPALQCFGYAEGPFDAAGTCEFSEKVKKGGKRFDCSIVVEVCIPGRELGHLEIEKNNEHVSLREKDCLRLLPSSSF